MKKIFFIFTLFISTLSVSAQPEFSSISSKPGSFSRLGFGARGMGMGNALSSVTTGNLVSYYNPALTVYQENNSFQTSYSFLSLDRSLNFLSFTRKFDFYSKKDTSSRIPSSTAGLSIGLINGGVGKIDGRDNQGIPTGELSTSENQFFLSFAVKFSSKFSLGFSAKLYYYKLFEEVTSTGLGFDIGALYRINDEFAVSAMIADLNSKYKWDTSPIYGQEGVISEDKFPNLKKLGISYSRNDLGLIAALEFENSNAQTNILRAGVEYNIYERLFIRAGLDQFNLSNSDFAVKPSAGFSYSKDFDGLIIGVDYAFVIEQYSSTDRHIVGINVNF